METQQKEILRIVLIVLFVITATIAQLHWVGFWTNADYDVQESSVSYLTNSSNISRGRLLDTKPPSKGSSAILFISITSARDNLKLREAIRATWLIPCIASPKCEYRFFIDQTSAALPATVRRENMQYNDLVFRESCPLMQRHPSDINYGNAPATDTNLMQIPDYQFRRLYKVDWKICFLKWALSAGLIGAYQVFVEDDSFVCTGNLLHQVQILHSLNPDEKGLPFRTGTSMYDGFDDSSTFMSSEIARVFAEAYPDTGFNCPQISESTDSAYLRKMQWCSWGNSWMRQACNWRDALYLHAGLNISMPLMDCAYFMFKGERDIKGELGLTHDPTEKNETLPLDFPCTSHSIILHHARASHILINEGAGDKLKHICEYMLLMDKIKDPMSMKVIYRSASANHYHDFSPVFTHDKEYGWELMLRAFLKHEKACETDPLSKECTSYRRRRLLQNEVTGRELYGENAAANARPSSAGDRLDGFGDDFDDPGFRAYFGGLIERFQIR